MPYNICRQYTFGCFLVHKHRHRRIHVVTTGKEYAFQRIWMSIQQKITNMCSITHRCVLRRCACIPNLALEILLSISSRYVHGMRGRSHGCTLQLFPRTWYTRGTALWRACRESAGCDLGDNPDRSGPGGCCCILHIA